MIIKSLARKGGDRAFTQLYDYISRKATDDRIWHNFHEYQPDRARTIDTFVENSTYIKHSPQRNICYHEIISLKRDKARGQAFEQRQIDALRQMTLTYLQQRAGTQLAYAAIHLDQADTIHVHLMISSNGLESDRRVRLDKFEFLQIQKSLELNLQQKFPELNELTVYNKPWELSRKLSDKEINLKRRTNDLSKKDHLRQTVEQVFASSLSREEAVIALAELNIDLTQRGKSIVVSQDGLRCRLKTLGIEDQYLRLSPDGYTPPSRGRSR